MANTVELKDALVVSDNQTGVFGSEAGKFGEGSDSRFPTTDEKAALAGTGTPSVSNKYVTDDDSRLSDARPIEWVSVPAKKTSAGTVGQAARDDKHIYVVIATNVWGRGIIAKNWPA